MQQASDDRIALITGGTRGIGLGIARCLSEAGFRLALVGRRSEREVSAVLEELFSGRTAAAYFPADLSRTKEHGPLLEAIRKRFGALHVLVNNAGIGPPERKDILQATEDSFDTTLAVNLRGPYFLTQRVARWMIEQRKADSSFRGVIVFVTSVSAVAASIDRGEYCISKAGLSMAARLWAVRLAEFGIPVYEVRPGIVFTDMTAPVKDKYEKLIAGGVLLQRRWGTPEDVGLAVRSLVTGDFPYSTGQIFPVDGGMLVERL